MHHMPGFVLLLQGIEPSHFPLNAESPVKK